LLLLTDEDGFPDVYELHFPRLALKLGVSGNSRPISLFNDGILAALLKDERKREWKIEGCPVSRIDPPMKGKL
jgi:hypothetical protein